MWNVEVHLDTDTVSSTHEPPQSFPNRLRSEDGSLDITQGCSAGLNVAAWWKRFRFRIVGSTSMPGLELLKNFF